MMSEKIELPRGWEIKKLGDLCEKITKGGTPTTYGFSFIATGINFIKVENIENGKVILSSIKNFISKEAHKYQKKSMLEENDLLFSIAGTIGETCLINKEYLPANTNQALAILRGYTQYVLPQFLTHQLASSISRYVKLKARGGAMNNISLEDLKAIDLVVPPLPEQQAIVAKIEQLLSDLENGKQQLQTAQEQLKIYRQSLLKAAFEGKLSNGIEEWKTVKLKDASLKIVVGYVGPITQFIVDSGGVRFLSTTHIGENEFLNHDLREVAISFNEKNKKSQVIPGDILIARHGDSGKACIVPDTIQIAQVSNAVILRPNPAIISSKFICYRLNAERQRMQKMKVGGVFQVVNTESMKSFLISIPPIKEQQRIVSSLESKLTVCDNIEKTITQSLSQTETLRQSILKKAFEGKLV